MRFRLLAFRSLGMMVLMPCLGALAGCAPSGPETGPPFKPVSTNLQLMDWILDPAADVIWGAVGTIITEAGTEELVPSTDEEWDAVRNAAAVLAESGNLLMIDPRARDHQDWNEISLGLIDVSMMALEAAEARDPVALFDAGGLIYNVCASCHQQYMVASEDAPRAPLDVASPTDSGAEDPG
jgi:hypothetical protein